MEAISEIKKLLEEGKLVIGSDRTLKNLKAGKTGKVFLCSNPDANLKEDLEHYCTVGGVEIVQLDVPNDELGAICKKPFSIQVLST